MNVNFLRSPFHIDFATVWFIKFCEMKKRNRDKRPADSPTKVIEVSTKNIDKTHIDNKIIANKDVWERIKSDNDMKAMYTFALKNAHLIFPGKENTSASINTTISTDDPTLSNIESESN